MDNQQLERLRQDYSANSLDIKDVKQNPIDQFKVWFEEAQKAEIKEPNAMILGTSDIKGYVTQRTVLLKGLSEKGFVWYTNYESTKAKALEENNKASLIFLWLELQRQIRIEGYVEKIEAAASLKYFQSRPRGSQIGAWASPQSSPIANREVLDHQVQEMEKKFQGTDEIPLPPHWGGYILIPERIEFWQGRKSRLHDRILFERDMVTGWNSVRLAP